MHDTFLLNKISYALKELCNEHKIRGIEQFTLVVNHDSHIDEKSLREHIKLHNTEIIASELRVEIQREEIEKQTAIIKSIQGETFGSHKRPILILNKKEPSILPDIIAPNTRKIGIMLPYTPLHFRYY